MAKKKQIVTADEYDAIMDEFYEKLAIFDDEKMLKDEKFSKLNGLFVVDYKTSTFEEQRETAFNLIREELCEGGATGKMDKAIAYLKMAENLGLISSGEFQAGLNKALYMKKNFPQIKVEE